MACRWPQEIMGLQAFIISHAPQLLAEPSEGMKIWGAIINKKDLLMEQVLLLIRQKNWDGDCPLGPHSSTALLLLHSSILDSTQSYNPPQLSSAHRCAGTVFDMESLKKSNKGCKIMEGIFQQYGTKWKEVFEIKPPLQFSQIWFKSLDGAEN